MQTNMRLFSRYMGIAFCFFFISITHPISQGAAWAGAGVTGLSISFPALFLPGEWKLTSVPLFGIGFFIGRQIFYQFTPDCRMAKAEYQLEALASHRLARVPCVTERQLFGIIEDEYVTRHWPLIAAFNDLTSYINISRHAKNLANRAKWEDRSFAGRALRLNAQADIFVENMREALKKIRVNKNYLMQLDQFKEEQRHNEHMAVQRSMAQAQWNNAKAQHEIAEAQKEMAAIKKRELDIQERKSDGRIVEKTPIGCVNVIVNCDGRV